MNISVRPKSLLVALLSIMAFLIAAHLTMYFVVNVGGNVGLSWLRRIFHVDFENNIPTWFSSCLLLFAALLLFVIAADEKKRGSRFFRQWKFLAFLFIGLSIDEMSSIHEELIRPLRDFFGASGLFFYTWVVAGLALVAVVALYCFRWFWQLPARTRALSGAAAILFVGGAIGTEMVGGYVQYNNMPGFTLHTTAEEVLEMTGAILWIYALADYAKNRITLNISFDGQGKSMTPAASGPSAGAVQPR